MSQMCDADDADADTDAGDAVAHHLSIRRRNP
jgi:hypothetical protein